MVAGAASVEWLAVVDDATGLQLIPLKSQAAAPVAVPSRLNLPSAVTALAFAPDSTRLAFCQEDGFVKLYEICYTFAKWLKKGVSLLWPIKFCVCLSTLSSKSSTS